MNAENKKQDTDYLNDLITINLKLSNYNLDGISIKEARELYKILHSLFGKTNQSSIT